MAKKPDSISELMNHLHKQHIEYLRFELPGLLDAASKQRLFEGIHIFHTVRNHYVPFLDDLVPTLRAYGIDVITHNCEYAGSQYETNYGPGKNLAGVDKAFAFKNGMKELAHR